MEELTSVVPFIGVISQIVMWVGLIFVLTMFRGFISHGVSLAIAEWLLKVNDDLVREKVCRWLGDKDTIIEHLESIKEQNKAFKGRK